MKLHELKYMSNKDAYIEIQVLKEFVQFAAGLTEANAKNKEDAATIIERIESLNQSETYKPWNACIDIFDRRLQDGDTGRKGVYWRNWSVWFEKDHIEIEAKSRIAGSVPPYDIFPKHYYYYFYYFFSERPADEFHQQTAPVIDFINDAKKYHSYITEHLKDIEVDIYI
jgi:hypothetical protein